MPPPVIEIDVFPIDRDEARATARALCDVLGEGPWTIRIVTNYGDVHWRVDVIGELNGSQWTWSRCFDPVDQIPSRIAACCARARRLQVAVPELPPPRRVSVTRIERRASPRLPGNVSLGRGVTLADHSPNGARLRVFGPAPIPGTVVTYSGEGGSLTGIVKWSRATGDGAVQIGIALQPPRLWS